MTSHQICGWLVAAYERELTQGGDVDTMTKQPHFTRAERGFAKKAANRMLTQEHREFESDTSHAVYTTRVMLDGKLMCDCRGWTIKKRDQPRQCKHTREVVGERQTVIIGEFLYVAAYRPTAVAELEA